MLLFTKYVLIIISPFCPPCLLCLVDLPEVTGTHRKFRSIVSSLIGMDFIPDAGIALYQVQATARTFTSEKIRFDYNKNTYFTTATQYTKNYHFTSPKKRKKNTTFYSSFLKSVCMITLLMLNINCDFHLSLYYSLLQS